MKVAILAGGRGERMGAETRDRPKPMVEVGGRPLLWHVMRHYAHHGHRHFAIALGYRGDVVRRYFRDEPSLTAGLRVDLVDTGPDTNTGGRLRRLAGHLRDGTFFLTWGDGLADVDLDALLAFHRGHGRLATVTAVHPPPRFGSLALEGDRVTRFREKAETSEWINGAFFALEPGVLDYVEGDEVAWEAQPMTRLCAEGELMAYRHTGFWRCVDTPRERDALEELWKSGAAPWATWERRT